MCSWGHYVAYVTLSDAPSPQRSSVLPVLSFDDARAQQWDMVMVPGAGFPDTTIEKLGAFHAPNFGTRIQHILNDQSIRAGFRRVNAIFAPHVVVFNNHHWPVGSFTDLHADRFQFLIGAVDPVIFESASSRRHPVTKDRWVIGGQARKNPGPLIEAVNRLPPNFILRLFGPDDCNLAESQKHLIETKRLELAGVLNDSDLPNYYRSLDCVVMTETFAGWANLAAEAMACGVPVLCTPHGTGAFARHNETALVVPIPTPTAIAEGVQRLMDDPGLCERLAARGRETIVKFNWENYAQELLRLIPRDGGRHYAHAPELGLYGKWPVSEHLRGLEPLLKRAWGMNVIDFGAGEGVVGLIFLQNGARYVHGFEFEQNRVSVANRLCKNWPGSEYRQADFSAEWHIFEAAHADLLRDAYDVVLYLGLHHHLPAECRVNALTKVLARARRYFAIRTPQALYEADAIGSTIEAAGFARIDEEVPQYPNHLSEARIYQRI